jgi:hypothetical protein
MISNKRNRKRKKHIHRTSTSHGNGTAQHKRPGRELGSQVGLRTLRSMIVNGELGIFKLISTP